MGHTVYYKTKIARWEDLNNFLQMVCLGLGLSLIEGQDELVLYPGTPIVEPLRIEREGEGFAKTNLVEPYHSVYLLILHSLCSFGSVELWED